MAIDRAARYPGRFLTPSADYPQGAFKNRTDATSRDGSFLEKDWANDFAGFFDAILATAGVSPSGTPDTAQASQYLSALLSLTAAGGLRVTPVATIAALAARNGLAQNEAYWVLELGLQGFFFVDLADTTTTADGVDVVAMANSVRAKRRTPQTPKAISANYTVTAADHGTTLKVTAAAVITLPEDATEVLPPGFYVNVKRATAGEVSFAVEGTDALESVSSHTKIADQYGWATAYHDSPGTPGTWSLFGGLGA